MSDPRRRRPARSRLFDAEPDAMLVDEWVPNIELPPPPEIPLEDDEPEEESSGIRLDSDPGGRAEDGRPGPARIFVGQGEPQGPQNGGTRSRPPGEAPAAPGPAEQALPPDDKEFESSPHESPAPGSSAGLDPQPDPQEDAEATLEDEYLVLDGDEEDDGDDEDDEDEATPEEPPPAFSMPIPGAAGEAPSEVRSGSPPSPGADEVPVVSLDRSRARAGPGYRAGPGPREPAAPRPSPEGASAASPPASTGPSAEDPTQPVRPPRFARVASGDKAQASRFSNLLPHLALGLVLLILVFLLFWGIFPS